MRKIFYGLMFVPAISYSLNPLPVEEVGSKQEAIFLTGYGMGILSTIENLKCDSNDTALKIINDSNLEVLQDRKKHGFSLYQFLNSSIISKVNYQISIKKCSIVKDSREYSFSTGAIHEFLKSSNQEQVLIARGFILSFHDAVLHPNCSNASPIESPAKLFEIANNFFSFVEKSGNSGAPASETLPVLFQKMKIKYECV